MNRDLTGPECHRSALDPLGTRTGLPWPESADPTRHQPRSSTPSSGRRGINHKTGQLTAW
jgi:hypothetical protein